MKGPQIIWLSIYIHHHHHHHHHHHQQQQQQQQQQHQQQQQQHQTKSPDSFFLSSKSQVRHMGAENRVPMPVVAVKVSMKRRTLLQKKPLRATEFLTDV